MIVNNSLDEVKKRENALLIIKDLVENSGRSALFDLTGLSGGFIASPSEISLLETYVGPAIFEQDLQKVGKEHMGGEKVLPLNRTSSGILATILTLVSEGSNVVHYLANCRPIHQFQEVANWLEQIILKLMFLMNFQYRKTLHWLLSQVLPWTIM